MSIRKGSALDQALDAAVDEILDTQPVAPPSPSVIELCKAAGIGASTFYRLFADVNDFRRNSAVWHLQTAYDQGREAVTELLDSKTGDSEGELPTPIEEESFGPTPEEEFVALILAGSRLFGDASSATDTPEAHYLPWVDVLEVRAAVIDSFVASGVKYGTFYEDFLTLIDRDTVPATELEDFKRRIMAVTVGANLVPTRRTWETLVDRDVSAMNYCHVEIVDAMTISIVGE